MNHLLTHSNNVHQQEAQHGLHFGEEHREEQ